jgi:hypothetical protein
MSHFPLLGAARINVRERQRAGKSAADFEIVQLKEQALEIFNRHGVTFKIPGTASIGVSSSHL